MHGNLKSLYEKSIFYFDVDYAGSFQCFWSGIQGADV